MPNRRTPSQGSGTTESVCTPSPSNMTGSLDNILYRLKALEDAMSQSLGINVHAGQLDEFGQQLGWVETTYLGQSGWYQNENGNLIPPPGMSIFGPGVSYMDIINNIPHGTGSSQSAVFVDSDGNILLGSDGSSLFGSSVDTWNSGGTSTQDFARYTWLTSESRGITIGAFVNTASLTTLQMTTTQAGLYYSSLNFRQITNSDGTPQHQIFADVQINLPSARIGFRNQFVGICGYNNFTVNSGSISGCFYLDIGEVVIFTITSTADGGGTLLPTGMYEFSLARISA